MMNPLSHKLALWLLAHPLENAKADLAPYTRRVTTRGETLTVITAVDR